MSHDSKRAVVEGDKEDRISDLPENVIDHILGLLPAQDVARTSILSKNWRYIWPKIPYVVLDDHFLNRLRGRSQSSFRQTVDLILSLHLGDIVKFVLHIDKLRSSFYKDVDTMNEDVDRWMRHVTRDGGIKDLTLYFAEEDGSIYDVPSCVFNCTTLTRLELCYCIVKPPNSLDFPKLEMLYLEDVKIVPTTEFCFLNVPLVINFDLKYCCGTQYLHIVSPLVEVLCVYEVHYVVLNYFMNCKKLRELHLSFFNMVNNMIHDERSTVEKLLFSLAPTLEKLNLTSSILELLNAGTIPKGPFCMLNCLRDVTSLVDFSDFSQTSALLLLITSIPNLSKLEIYVDGSNNSAYAAKRYKKYLQSPACSNQLLNKLKHVMVRWFGGSKVVMLFIKLLFARAPSLVKMSLEEVRHQENIARELISCPKASPNAELYFFPS